MTRWCAAAVLILALSAWGAAQDQSSAADRDAASRAQAPSGTKVQKIERDTIVRPKAKPVALTPDVIRSVQKALNDRGYDAGAIDGYLGTQTRAAVRKFQANQNLTTTGDLDAATLAKLNVGSVQVLSTAPADVGRGGKAFGHDVKQGHPVAASKALGQGTATAGKNVGRGVKSAVVGGVDKLGKGLSSIGRKVSNKTEGKDKDKDKNPETPHL